MLIENQQRQFPWNTIRLHDADVAGPLLPKSLQGILIIFDAVISSLSIHHLDDIDKRKLFTRIYDSLPNGGLFVNYDRNQGRPSA